MYFIVSSTVSRLIFYSFFYNFVSSNNNIGPHFYRCYSSAYQPPCSRIESLYNYANAEIVVQISAPLREFRRCFSAKMVVGGPLRSLERPKDNKTVYKDGFQKKNRRFCGAKSRQHACLHRRTRWTLPPAVRLSTFGEGGGCYGSINVSGWALCLVARKRALKSPSPFNNSVDL